MSSGNDFWATRAGHEYLAAAKNIAHEIKAHNRLVCEQNELLSVRNDMLRQQTEAMQEIAKAIRLLGKEGI